MKFRRLLGKAQQYSRHPFWTCSLLSRRGSREPWRLFLVSEEGCSGGRKPGACPTRPQTGLWWVNGSLGGNCWAGLVNVVESSQRVKKGLRPATVHKEGDPQKMPVFRLFTLGEWSEPQILQAAANLGGIPGCFALPGVRSLPLCAPLPGTLCHLQLLSVRGSSDQALLALGQLSRFSLWALVGSSLPLHRAFSHWFLFVLAKHYCLYIIISEITCHYLDRGRVGALQLGGGIMFIDICIMYYVSCTYMEVSCGFLRDINGWTVLKESPLSFNSEEELSK